MFLKQVRSTLIVRSNISVIFLDATRYTAKHLIYEHICDGTPVNDHLFVPGCIVASDSLALMSCRGIAEHTLARNGSNARSATKDSCEAITYQSTSRPTTRREVNMIRWWK